MRLRTLLLLLTSCAELRKGWVRVDFIEGEVAPEMVCQMKVNADGDLEAICVDLKTLAADILKSIRPTRCTPET